VHHAVQRRQMSDHARAFARNSSAASGFFFWGMIELPELHASGSSQKENSTLDHSTSSAPRRDRWVEQVAAAPR